MILSVLLLGNLELTAFYHIVIQLPHLPLWAGLHIFQISPIDLTQLLAKAIT